MTFRCTPMLLILAVLGACQRSSDKPLGDRTHDGRLSPALTNLGNYHRATTTSVADAQKYFDQGLVLLYGFNHAESLRSFQEAARVDPKCGMCYWGQALALAPNINDPAIGPDREKQGAEAIAKALGNKTGLKPVEAGLIDALAARFDSAAETPDREKLNKAYATAMTALYARFPDDHDVATLYADSVMNTRPWDYWDRATGKPQPGIAEAVGALENVMQAMSDHPGANHVYIHAVEASPNPDRAVPAADRLGGLVPGAGHLVHMPSHIYIRVGRYADGTAANRKAITADEDYITQCRAQGIYPAGYYPHNVHFLFATLSMEGRSKEAHEAAVKVSTRHTHDQFEGLGGFPYLLRAMPFFSQVRFGKWDDILAAPDPGSDLKFVQAVRHFARGYAHLAKGDAAAAEAELKPLEQLAKDPDLAGMKVFELNSLAQIASIGEHMLAGEIAAARKNGNEGVRRLNRAIEIEDGLLYSEPPDWPLPPRQYLGAMLLNAGRAREAEAVFRKDLDRHRDNGWSLRGLALALAKQGKAAEAATVEERFRKAWSHADIELASARL